MPPFCSETVFSFRELFLFYPLWTAIALIATGALLLGLWVKLKGGWRLLPAVIVFGLAWLAVSEPVRLSMRLASARELIVEGAWRNKPSFELRGSAEKVIAYRADLGSECSTGFLVTVENYMHTDSWGFAGGYPKSPEGYRFQEQQSFINHSYNFCSNRADVLYGKNWRKEHPDACAERLPPMAYFDMTRSDSPGFQMKWCRKLEDRIAYCEAETSDVFLARGGHF